MDVKIEPSWKAALAAEFTQPYFLALSAFVREAYQQTQVFPKGSAIFKAFEACPLEQVKVVILGQDPYHGPNQAHGLSFSVQQGVPFPPSLQNIFKEIRRDLGTPFPEHGDLTRWAEQGVLLLNATLTVQAHQAGSHQKKGWEQFTDAVIRVLAEREAPMVFLLWGAYAQKKAAILHRPEHLKLHAPHPSPLSAHRGFHGCGHFSQTNAFLQEQGLTPIKW
ncbi:uracil-DNA glycosylase [Nitritalea halalkaliphila LW7]|uniref:Uracil-DNA glycosylase n=1 Tax=Nitritalea halalkaliphila LW7 TaxID=1189621 RepID=I5BU38_9BACT|nr:uracil-DNA glycosylase [Nitritalea halalkaliphila]EIM73090.1 uracil-DNA glycosylase [Nitritalea halalkaliphila LW7]